MEEIKVGARIAKLREQYKMTQMELADKLAVTDRAVSKWETGGSYPDITLLPQIADIFNVTIDYLLRGVPENRHMLININPDVNKTTDSVNSNFLSKGWKVVDMKLAGCRDGASGTVLLEKAFYLE